MPTPSYDYILIGAGTGIGASNHFEAGAFVRSRDELEIPNLQYHFVPIAMNYDGRNPADGHGFQMHVGPMKGTSTGHVRIRSSDPRDPPSIIFNYLTTERGALHTLVDGEQPPETIGGVRLIAVEAHRCILPFEAQSVVASETRPANRGLCAGDGLPGANARDDRGEQRAWIATTAENGPQQRWAERGRDAIGLALSSGLVEKPACGRRFGPWGRFDPQIVPVLDDPTRECSDAVDVPQAHGEPPDVRGDPQDVEPCAGRELRRPIPERLAPGDGFQRVRDRAIALDNRAREQRLHLRRGVDVVGDVRPENHGHIPDPNPPPALRGQKRVQRRGVRECGLNRDRGVGALGASRAGRFFRRGSPVRSLARSLRRLRAARWPGGVSTSLTGSATLQSRCRCTGCR